MLTGMLVRDFVSNGPENLGSRVSWILGLTLSPHHNVQTCALEHQEAESLVQVVKKAVEYPQH